MKVIEPIKFTSVGSKALLGSFVKYSSGFSLKTFGPREESRVHRPGPSNLQRLAPRRAFCAVSLVMYSAGSLPKQVLGAIFFLSTLGSLDFLYDSLNFPLDSLDFLYNYADFLYHSQV